MISEIVSFDRIKEFLLAIKQVFSEDPSLFIALVILTMVFGSFIHRRTSVINKEFVSLLITLIVAIFPVITTYLTYAYPEPNGVVTSAIFVLTIIDIVSILVASLSFYKEQRKNGYILSIKNANSRSRSESITDEAIARAGRNLVCRKGYICRKAFSKLSEKKFQNEVNDATHRMVHFLSKAYDKSSDKIGVNVWVNMNVINDTDSILKKSAGDTGGEEDGQNTQNGSDCRQEWYAVFRRYTNEDPSVARIVWEKNTAFNVVKDDPGMKFFSDKRKAFFKKKYSLAIPNNTKRLRDLIETYIKGIRLKGSIYCHNISISLNDSSQIIQAVVSVTSYKESLCGRWEKEEIENALECFGLEIRSILASNLLMFALEQEEEQNDELPPCGIKDKYTCLDHRQGQGICNECCIHSA